MASGTVVVFAGPTIGHSDVRALLPAARVMPPIAAADLWDLDLGPGDTVAVIDGYYFQRRSVRHKELVALCDRGVTVAGAASLGALRAAELEPFGMIGVGQVFQWYRSGLIEGDDEVAVVHGSPAEGFPAFSEAMVTVRATVDAAVAAGDCPPRSADLIVAALVAMPFTERTVAGMLTRIAAELGPELAEEFARIWTKWQVDVKREDAETLLRMIARDELPERDVRSLSAHVDETDVAGISLFLGWAASERGTTGDSGAFISEGLMVACARMLAADFPVLHRRVALAAALPSDPPDQAVLTELLTTRGLIDQPSDIAALVNPWLTETERDSANTVEQLTIFLARTHTAPWLAEQTAAAMDRMGIAKHWRAVADRVLRLNAELIERRPNFDFDRVPVDDVRRWCERRWLGADTAVTDQEWLLALADRGFVDERTWRDQARRTFPFALLRADRYEDLRIFDEPNPTDAKGDQDNSPSS
ncbi:MAG: TfuA-like protein [Candidatus Nanopelagicales bacterium]|nr:TfuA-like protein [Candidatus Nanopelagicales bacterium]